MTEHAENLPSLGSWIRRRRKALDLTQAALAQRVGCAEVTIRKLEADVVRPSRETAERLARYLDLPPHEHAVFVQVARSACSVEWLPAPLTGLAPSVSVPAEEPPPEGRLPRDMIPAPAPLPLGSRMPLSRNPLFVGRDANLRLVAEALTARGTAAIGQGEIAATTGLGGIGKTQLACEFVHRYGQFFAGGVFWLSFADPAVVPAEVAACGGLDGMRLSAAFDQLPLDTQVQLVLAEWHKPAPRLLVFDNCEDATLLDQWRPKHGGCRVLLTSRRHHWDPALGVHTLSLDVLRRTDSLALLRRFRPDLPPDDPDLQAIAEILGDLPLALHLAGSFLAKYRHALTPTQYGARLHAPTILDDRSLQAAGLSPTQHVQHVARTFEQSYVRLDGADPTDALALTLLAHAACFAPGEPLPRWLLLATLHLADDDPESGLLAEDALTRLIDLGLLETDAARNLRMHRLLVAFVQAVLVEGTAQAVVEATMLRVADDLNEQRNPRPVLAIQPHLRFLVEAALAHADTRAAALCYALGVHLWQLGVFGKAQRYQEQALAIRQQVLGDDHPDTARSLYMFALVLHDQGQFREAQHAYARALTIRQRVLGDDHPDTARSLNGLGCVFLDQGHYQEARSRLEHALVIRQRVFGMEHPDTATSLSNLGRTLLDQGHYQEARSRLEHALAIRQRVLGKEHASTTASLTNLGHVLMHQGQYAAAQRYHEQALAIVGRVLGMEHPFTAAILSNVGAVFQSQGQYAQAQGSYEQALAIRLEVLGMEHPNTAITLNQLGEALTAQGHYAEAQGYLEQALAIRQRVLEVDHPDTAMSLNNLGLVFQAQGQYVEAQHFYEQGLAIFEQVLGTDHPHTAMGLQNLGNVLREQGQYAEAQAYHEQALAINERVLGADHPNTANSFNNLGEVFHAQGQYTDAQRAHEQALAIRQQVLGADHPSTAESFHNLGMALKEQGQYADAQRAHEQALATRQRVLGTDHPDTARSLRGVGEVLHAQGDVAQARPYLGQALAILAQRLGAQHPDTEHTQRLLVTLDAARSVGDPES